MLAIHEKHKISKTRFHLNMGTKLVLDSRIIKPKTVCLPPVLRMKTDIKCKVS